MTDALAIAAIILWPVVPLFWIPVHCLPDFFRKLGSLTYIMPFITWLPLAYIIYLNRSFLLSFRTEFPLMIIIMGILLLFLGILLHIWTGVLLGMWALVGLPEIDIKTKGRLVTGGAFSIVRHPTYLAHTLMLSGIFFITSVIAVGIVTLLDFLFIYLVIVPLEERELINRFGEEYKQYKGRVPRFFPRTFRKR